jgi:Ca-activated chloride channel family protein
LSGLSPADFAVYEAGARKEIVSFRHERTPISIALLIDTSGSIGTKLSRIRAAAARIIRQGYPDDEWAVLEFKGTTQVRQEFTTNAIDAERALNQLKAAGETALLDAVKHAIHHMQEKGRHDRKAVVLVTDGGEANSRCRRDEVLQMLVGVNVQLYAIGFPDGLTQSAAARSLLDELAKASSGGRSFYPNQTAELDEIAKSIANALRTPRYRLSYYSTGRSDDTREPVVRIEVAARESNAVVRTRLVSVSPPSTPVTSASR